MRYKVFIIILLYSLCSCGVKRDLIYEKGQIGRSFEEKHTKKEG